jgi:hypothetical protein
MKKRKKIKALANKKVIFFSLIMSMSFIGVGYAEWNDSLSIDLSIKTGFTCKNFDVGNYKSYDDGELYFTVSDDGDTLIIKGKVYPTFNEDLTINLVDSGSLPSIIADIQDIQDEDNDISTLKGSINNQRTAFYNNEIKDSFNINIKPEVNNNIINQLNAESFEYDDEVSSLEEEVANLNNEISAYKTIEKRNFKYTISYEFEKNIWEKDLIIEGNIDVIPDPEILSSMESRLVDLQNILDEKYEAKKILEEQQRLLEEKTLQEEQKSLEQGNIEQNLQENEKIGENNSNIVPETEKIDMPESDEEVINETEDELNNDSGVNNTTDELEQTDETTDLTNTEEPGNEQQDISSEVNNEVENIEKEKQGDETIN